MTSWLSKRKKDQLLELANTAGLKADEDLRKDELISNLDEYLQQNATRLQGQSAFEPYYSTRRPKPRESLGVVAQAEKTAEKVTSDAEAEVKAVVKKTVKKANKVKAEVENSSILATPGKVFQDVVSTISSPFTNAAKTPASRRSSSMNVTLPASPAVVAEEIERATSKFYSGVGDLYSVSGIPDTFEWLRGTCSSVAGVQTSILLFEAYFLQQAVLPWKHAFDLPSIPLLHIPSIAVKLPDLFILLSSSFWGPTILWTITSILLPLSVSYFYNLTQHNIKRNGAKVQALRFQFDPMIGAITKAIVAVLVYGAHAPSNYIDTYSARVIDHAIPGGYRGIVTGSFIQAVAAIWEATQR